MTIRTWASFKGLSDEDYISVTPKNRMAFTGRTTSPDLFIVLEGFEPDAEMAGAALNAGVNFAKIPITKTGPHVVSSTT
jgi:hypothetical protein